MFRRAHPSASGSFVILCIVHEHTHTSFDQNMSSLVTRTLDLLGQRSTYRALLVLNCLITLLIMWVSRNVMLSDAWSYIALAEGLLHGEYSMWWPLEGSYPDTFRAPGYPLFVAGIMAVTGTWKAVVWVQLALYVFALWGALELIKRLDERLVVRSLFLLLLLPLVNIPYYITQVYTEIPTLALVSALLLLVIRRDQRSWLVAILIGLLFGALFQLKPVAQFLPLFFVVLERFYAKDRIKLPKQVLTLAVYVLTLLPYGLWNQRQHGVFKVTPLEGAGSYMHFAGWCGRLPGYTEKVYWHNFAGDELVRFVPETDVPKYIAAYEQEWEEINAQVLPLLTAHDSVMLASRDQVAFGVVNTYNTEFTLLREKLLVQKAFEHLLADPWYTVRTKAYTAVREWVIGIQVGEFRKAAMAGKLQMIYATVSTGGIFLLFLIVVPWGYYTGRLKLRATWPLLAIMVYIALFYLPFPIQARYTTPVRFAMLTLMALAMIAPAVPSAKSKE